MPTARNIIHLVPKNLMSRGVYSRAAMGVTLMPMSILLSMSGSPMLPYLTSRYVSS